MLWTSLLKKKPVTEYELLTFLISKYDFMAKHLLLTFCYRIVKKSACFKTVMIKYLSVLCLITLFGCVSNPPSSNTLGVIDLSGNYPIRKVDLKDIADLEYVPLETTDSSLLSGKGVFCNAKK